MLDSINLNDKGFEQIRDEAVAQIPIYSRDWTNYNISDPGITILENLAAFLALQQSELNEVPEKIKKELLGLAGFTIRKGNAANIYVSFKHAAKLPYIMPAGAKLYAQDICFEPEGSICVRDIGITSVKADAVSDGRLQMLLEPQGVRGGLTLLGKEPGGGESISFYVKDLPDAGIETAIHFELAQRFCRNHMEAGARNPFVAVKWEMRTTDGYSPLEVYDETCGFLQSGYVFFRLRKKLRKHAIKDVAADAYVIRITVVRADYDIVPRFEKISGLLMHLVQKDTKSNVVQMRLSGNKEIYVRHYLLKNGIIEIYGRQQENRHENGAGVCYREYHEGLQYRAEYVDSYTRKIIFEREAPEEIMVVCRDESVMVHRRLGMLYGYDNQVIPLPDNARVYSEALSVLVMNHVENEDSVCHLVKPEAIGGREVRYSVNEKENTLVIHDCGIYEGAQLWLGDYVVYGGEGGNILAGAQLKYEHEGAESLQVFICCTEASDGYFEEDCTQLQRRFSRDVRTPMTMVTQTDCECIVRNIPGLSIHKIGVCAVPDKNEIHIAVKPNSYNPRPMLSQVYIDEIYQYLERYRMLTTKLIIEQPVYVPVNVTGVIYVKKHFERCRERIEEMLGKALDGIHSDAQFGSRIVFYEIYRLLCNMDAVDRIHELSIFPESFRNASMSGMDIVLDFNALYYPGSFRLELPQARGNLD